MIQPSAFENDNRILGVVAIRHINNIFLPKDAHTRFGLDEPAVIAYMEDGKYYMCCSVMNLTSIYDSIAKLSAGLNEHLAFLSTRHWLPVNSSEVLYFSVESLGTVSTGSAGGKKWLFVYSEQQRQFVRLPNMGDVESAYRWLSTMGNVASWYQEPMVVDRCDHKLRLLRGTNAQIDIFQKEGELFVRSRTSEFNAASAEDWRCWVRYNMAELANRKWCNEILLEWNKLPDGKSVFLRQRRNGYVYIGCVGVKETDKIVTDIFYQPTIYPFDLVADKRIDLSKLF